MTRENVTAGRRIIVAVTGASGSVYARLLVERLLAQPGVGEIALVISPNGREVARYEGQTPLAPEDSRIREFAFDDMFAPPASGSARYDAMAIVPCSMGTVGRIAAGVSGDLIARAADVMLKERRTLVVVPRETPLGTIHLRNLTTLSECGAVVLPAAPSFYRLPASMTDICMSVVERIADHLGFPGEGYRWEGEADKG